MKKLIDKTQNTDPGRSLERDGNELIFTLYQILLRREPTAHELNTWSVAARNLAPSEVIRRFAASKEYRRRMGVDSFFPPGHFHSPVVDPEIVTEYVEKFRSSRSIAGILIDIDAQSRFWDANARVIASVPFGDKKTDDYRFYYEDAPFPYGDAITLYTLLGHFRPKRIIEIGSGYSTACILDSADAHNLSELKITCIEPFPNRLIQLLRPEDYERVTIIAKPVQSVPHEDIAEVLDANDILFIDSTHVLKTGSDVHHELFHVLPALRPGVVIHVHDCPFPFEYPRKWIGLNYSWNEAYALRAFLMFNDDFRIFFWGSMMQKLYAQKVLAGSRLFARNPGTSIWLRREH